MFIVMHNRLYIILTVYSDGEEIWLDLTINLAYMPVESNEARRHASTVKSKLTLTKSTTGKVLPESQDLQEDREGGKA